MLTEEQKLNLLIQLEEAVYEDMEEEFMLESQIMFPFMDSHAIRWNWIELFRENFGYHLNLGSCEKGIYRRLI